MQSFQLNVTISNASTSKCTLLIPELKLNYFKTRSRYFGGTSAYVAWLVANYLPRLSEFRKPLNNLRSPNWNTSYQEKGQALTRKNFLPQGMDWECLRHAAMACGVSICFLFVFLMQIDADAPPPKKVKNPPVERNSIPECPIFANKFRKFSKIERILDIQTGILHRKLKIA